MKNIILESFTLDHTKLVAPYVRHAKTVPVPDSDYEIKVYDFRVKTPNIKLIDPKTIHTMEHLLATAIRGVFPERHPECKVVDLSPMGCRTGFYISVLTPIGKLSLEEMTDAVSDVIVGALSIDELPGATIETCGGYLEHDFKDAKDELTTLSVHELVPLVKPPFLS